MKQTLRKLMREYPNDFIVIANRWYSDFKISKNFSTEKEAIKFKEKYFNNLDIYYKVGIYQLNCFSLNAFLKRGVLI